jgi:hypothetical protein
MSIIESYGDFDGKVEPQAPGGPTWDLKTVHEQAVSTVQSEMRMLAHDLIELTLELFELLELELAAHWAARRDRVASVRDWEKDS